MKALKSQRLHIGVFGKTNVGKSSFVNKITGQDVSIVSDVAGTTTDVVEKSMEFLPIGPVTFMDTAGIDDNSRLGTERIERTKKVKDLTDDEVAALRKEIDNYVVEGDLRRDVQMSIKNKMEINCYQGVRHKKGLPVRGQRTSRNAKTRKGKGKVVANKKKAGKEEVKLWLIIEEKEKSKRIYLKLKLIFIQHITILS